MKARYTIALSALLTLGAVTLGKKMTDSRLELLRSNVSTTEYVAKKNDKFKILANKWIPESIRKNYDYHEPYLYLMELNKRTSSQIQIGETLRKPVYK